MSKDLATWLRNRLDEDEQVAREAMHRPRSSPPAIGHWGYVHEDLVDGDGLVLAPKVWIPAAKHTARWDPARVLAEVQAKRSMIDHLELAMPRLTPLNEWGAAEMDELAGNMLQLLALPYASHPDYRAEWAPEWWPYGEGNDDA